MMELPQPYSKWWHPERSWLDIALGFLVSWFFGTSRLIQTSPLLETTTTTTTTTSSSSTSTSSSSNSTESSSPHVDTRQECENVRKALRKASTLGFKSGIQKWSRIANCSIVEYKLKLPRRAILEEWGLLNDYDTSLERPRGPKKDIVAYVHVPSSILSTEDLIHASSEKNERSCREIENLDLSTIPTDVPFLITCHGGGLVMGEACDAELLGMVVRMTEIAESPVVMISIEYSLAPEYPFPTAVTEILTVLDYFVHLAPQRSIHLAGVSAGGNLVAVATMEMVRRYPGRVASSLVLIPMTQPACDTFSFYLNSTQVQPATCDWIRWCWRAYLQLPESQDVLSNPQSLEDLLVHRSNRTTWNSSQWKNTNFERLIDPSIDLPNSLHDAMAPSIIINTNSADCLYDDGMTLYRALKEKGAKVTLYDCKGAHWFGTALNHETYEAIVRTWVSAVFGART